MQNNTEQKFGQGPSFEESVSLAKKLFELVDERNQFITSQGGFDTFAEATQYMGDNRKGYDEMSTAFSLARKEFDGKVVDKKSFVESLRTNGENALADRISTMFQISE